MRDWLRDCFNQVCLTVAVNGLRPPRQRVSMK
jgi:hypothetical protein